jgi:hypothetical protein
MVVLLVIYDIWGLARIKKEHKRLKEEAERRRGFEAERRRHLLATTKE